jgi:hypothetical protein
MIVNYTLFKQQVLRNLGWRLARLNLDPSRRLEIERWFINVYLPYIKRYPEVNAFKVSDIEVLADGRIKCDHEHYAAEYADGMSPRLQRAINVKDFNNVYAIPGVSYGTSHLQSGYILDYIVDDGPENLHGMSVEQALDRSRAWHVGSNEATDDPGFVIDLGTHNEWHLEVLLDQQALKYEGYKQDHCVAKYWRDVKSGKCLILRTRKYDSDGNHKAWYTVEYYQILSYSENFRIQRGLTEQPIESNQYIDHWVLGQIEGKERKQPSGHERDNIKLAIMMANKALNSICSLAKDNAVWLNLLNKPQQLQQLINKELPCNGVPS